MTEHSNVDLREVVAKRNILNQYRDDLYVNTIKQINTQYREILKDDLGSQFVGACSRDLAGEVVRNCFDKSSFYVTVDQLAMRIWEFDYKNEYDPLKGNVQAHKNVYNYNEVTSSVIEGIVKNMDDSQELLFKKSNGKIYDDHKMIEDGKKGYRKKSTNEGSTTTTDDLTGNSGINNDVDHSQPLAAAKYNAKYIREKGVDEIKKIIAPIEAEYHAGKLL